MISRESIMEDIVNAATTCNTVIELMQGGKADNDTAMAMALVGINQALVSIAEAIMYKRDKKKGQEE